jgi:D-glycero-D-manno-heptose 1,7-bisphosphate phosphatase
MSAGHPAVFLDRDGVLVDDVGYLSSASGLRLFPGVPVAARALSDAGFKLVVATNQSAVARGILTEAQLEAIHTHLTLLLSAGGAAVDAWLYCPHHPIDGVEPYRRACDCRKPQPGMLLRARDLLGLDLSRSFLVGDRRSDVVAARRAGCTAILVRTGFGSEEANRPPTSEEEVPEVVVDTLLDAAHWIRECVP